MATIEKHPLNFNKDPMALNLSTVPLHTKITKPINPFTGSNSKQKQYQFCYFLGSSSSSLGASASSEGTEEGRGVAEEDPPTYSGSSSSRSQLDLLEQLTSSGASDINGYESSDGYSTITIRDQLARLIGDRDDDFVIPLGKNLKKVSPKFLTISQKRNIKRQTYLNEVSKRNDSVFFATIGAFVILPPIVILGIAIATGYVQLLP